MHILINIDDDGKIISDINNKSFYFGTNKSYLTAKESVFFIYSLNRKTDSNKKGNFKLPYDSNAKKIAKDFLEINGLLPKDFFISSINEGLVCEYADGTRDVENKQVTFHKKINGKDVEGVCRIQVDIGEGGIIERVASSYQDTEPHKNYKMIDINTAVANLKNNKGIEVFNGVKQP